MGKETPLGPAPQTLRPIFKDREEEAAGASIGASIEAAMLASEFLIVLCSPRSAQSKWVNREVAFFKRRRDPSRILTLIVDGEPMASTIPGREAEECFPKALLFKIGDDLTPGAEPEDAPLAADARETGDGKRGAKLKLAAALLGIGLDDLVRRDDRRRAARRRAVLAASLALAAVLGALSLYAFNQRDAAVLARDEAESQRNAALAAQARAVEARDDAEGLIEMILTDLKADLEGYGTLKSVTAIGNRAIGYYEGQDVRALTPDQLGRRARVLLMLGEADNKRGDLDAALARYETAAATTGEQLARDQGNPQRMFDHAQSVFWVGYIAWQRGDRATAKRQLTEYHDLAQKLVASDPANEDWKAELDYAYSNLGTLALDDGDPVAAEEYFRKSLEIARARLRKSPGDLENTLSVGQAHAWLADALQRQLKFNAAKDERLKELDAYNSHPVGAAQHRKILKASAVASYAIAQIDLSRGDPAAAAAHTERSIRALEALGAADGDNADILETASLAWSLWALSKLHLADVTSAARGAKEATKLAARLSELGSGAQTWLGHVWAQAALVSAKVEHKRNDLQAAKSILDDLIASQRPIYKQTPQPVIARGLCAALAARARLSADSITDWNEIVTVLGPAEDSATPEARAILAEALFQLGDQARSVALGEKLRKAGYRHPEFEFFWRRVSREARQADN